MTNQLKRGGGVNDGRDFSADSLMQLKKAAAHIRYLINEGYDIKSASVYVGNHFLLSERQRLALVRSISTDEQLLLRGNVRQRHYVEKRCILTVLIPLSRWKLRCVILCYWNAWTERSGIWQGFGEHTA